MCIGNRTGETEFAIGILKMMNTFVVCEQIFEKKFNILKSFHTYVYKNSYLLRYDTMTKDRKVMCTYKAKFWPYMCI